jgi:hypothetical protein
MNKEQFQASMQLTKALNRCHAVGLVGGVYEGKFCIWPKEEKPHEAPWFFAAIDELGDMIETPMKLDGGAGD